MKLQNEITERNYKITGVITSVITSIWACNYVITRRKPLHRNCLQKLHVFLSICVNPCTATVYENYTCSKCNYLTILT